MLNSEILTRAMLTLRPCRLNNDERAYFKRGCDGNHVTILPYVNVEMIIHPSKFVSFNWSKSYDFVAMPFAAALSNSAHHFYAIKHSYKLQAAWDQRHLLRNYAPNMEPYVLLGFAGLSEDEATSSPSFSNILEKFKTAIDMAECLGI